MKALRIIELVLVVLCALIPLTVVIPRVSYYFSPYYTEQTYRAYEQAFLSSQYRVKEHPAIIPDETLFSYVSGAYVRGMDPILANSEHTPLGKYLIGLSIILLKNDRFPSLLFYIVTLLSVYLLAHLVLKNRLFSLVSVLLVEIDVLIQNQIVIAPLLDIIQLPFILFTLYAFTRESEQNTYFKTAVLMAVTAATKTVVPAILLLGTFLTFFAIRKEVRKIVPFLYFMPVTAILFVATYARTFLSGYSFFDFLGFQKWIFLYQSSKLIYPFSSLRLLFLNQWQTWWGTHAVVAAVDWSILWPLSTVSSIIAGIVVFLQRGRTEKTVILLLLWVGIYQAFLSLGVVSSRFFLPVLPVQYILTVWFIQFVFKHLIGYTTKNSYAHRHKHASSYDRPQGQGNRHIYKRTR